MDIDNFKAIYLSMIRSHLEFAVQAWSPYLVKDITLLENVQRRATKLVYSIRNRSYDERKTALGLTSLRDRRDRGDLIQVFKIIHGFDNLRRADFFQLHSESNMPDTRGHEWKIVLPHTASHRRRKYFDIRVIKKWNALPDYVVRNQSISAFKVKLDRHLNL